MRSIAWSDSSQASPQRTPVKVERFGGKTRFRVHLLGEVRCKRVHYRLGENTMPCLDPEPCPFCADPIWKIRNEFFGPAKVMDPKRELWVPIVAVFTQGAWNQMQGGQPRPWRGRVLDAWRQPQGTTTVLKVKELSVTEPDMPAFEIEPVLLRTWFPHENGLPPVVVPEPVPYLVERPRAPVPVPTPVPKEAAAMLHAYVAKMRGDVKPDGEATNPAPENRLDGGGTAPVPATPTPPAPTPAAARATPAAKDGDPAELGSVMGGLLNGILPPDRPKPWVPDDYGDRKLVRPSQTAESEDEALSKSTGSAACDEQKLRSPHLNGHGRKGGAR